MRPTSIRIFLADGSPEGIRIVDKSNWVGRAIVASRVQIEDALRREELSRPGVYLLLGPGADNAPRLYIGEADVLRDRLKHHASGKDFWTRFVAFTSSDESLDKAMVRYLEARMIRLAREAKQWEVENGNEPTTPPLSEADRADADWFLDEMLVIYPVLGIDAFEAAKDNLAAAPQAEELVLSQRGASARGREVKDGFVVRQGSRARATETRSIGDSIRDLRKQLCDRGVLVPENDRLLFTQDYRFTSPSTASAVLVGGASNGRIAWKSPGGKTLKEIQDERVMRSP